MRTYKTLNGPSKPKVSKNMRKSCNRLVFIMKKHGLWPCHDHFNSKQITMTKVYTHVFLLI